MMKVNLGGDIVSDNPYSYPEEFFQNGEHPFDIINAIKNGSFDAGKWLDNSSNILNTWSEATSVHQDQEFYNMKNSIYEITREIYEKHCGMRAVVKYDMDFLPITTYVLK